MLGVQLSGLKFDDLWLIEVEIFKFQKIFHFFAWVVVEADCDRIVKEVSQKLLTYFSLCYLEISLWKNSQSKSHANFSSLSWLQIKLLEVSSYLFSNSL